MINQLLKFLTTRKEQRVCSFCKKPFISKRYKSRILGFKLINVVNLYCSKKCERAFNETLKKAFTHKKLNKQEKEAIKNVYYVDIKAPANLPPHSKLQNKNP